jgi:hypothetical protein
MIGGLGIIRIAVPADPTKPGIWLTDSTGRNAVRLALNLVPFAGVAFLRFMGVGAQPRWGVGRSVLCDRISGQRGALCGKPVRPCDGRRSRRGERTGRHHPTCQQRNLQFRPSRELYVPECFAIKMAGVFMFSTSTIALRTALFPRWVAFAGFVCGVALLVVISNWLWIALLFPCGYY